MSEEVIKDEKRYPENIAQGSIIKVEFENMEGEQFTELFLLVHSEAVKYILVNIYTGNRWATSFPANKANAGFADAEEVVKNLTFELTEHKVINVEILGHISELDIYSQLG